MDALRATTTETPTEHASHQRQIAQLWTIPLYRALSREIRYIAEQTTILIPYVQEIRIHDGGVESILMDHIESCTLQDAWSSMILSQKFLSRRNCAEMYSNYEV